MRPVPVLVLLITLFVAACTAFNVLTPYRTAGLYFAMGEPQEIPDIGAPDELQHTAYVAHLLEEGELPVLDPDDPRLGERYQSHQPPLYYVLAAGWATVTGGASEANGELTLETPEGGFALRFLNTLIGGATILAVYFGALWGLGRVNVALAAAAVPALLPMNVALHSAVSNDPLLFALISWALALALKSAAHGFELKVSLGIGVLAGLALLTKTSALALLPTLFVALVVGRRYLVESKPCPRHWLLMLLLPLVIATPLYLRNLNLYGDPFAISVFNEAFSGSPQASTFIERIGPVAYWTQAVGRVTAMSLIGAFGYMEIFLPMSFYIAGWVFIAVLLVGLVVRMRGLKQESADQQLPDPRPFLWINLALFVVALALFVQFNLTYYQAQARYLFPAIAPIAFALGLGAEGLMGGRSKYAWVTVSLVLAILLAMSLTVLPGAFEARMLPNS
jgi:4-amino-4-deoxy-L-arabinose transferase-like glycosyltransferase